MVSSSHKRCSRLDSTRFVWDACIDPSDHISHLLVTLLIYERVTSINSLDGSDYRTFTKLINMSNKLEHGGPHNSGGPTSITNISSQIARAIRSGTSALSDWILDWTPFVLVVTYFIVTTAIFVLCNEGTIKVFYFFYMATNFYIAATCVIESFLGLTPVRDARKAAIAVQECQQFPSDLNGKVKDLPIINIVIVAYLPNEKVSLHRGYHDPRRTQRKGTL